MNPEKFTVFKIDYEEAITDIATEGYTNLSKWLIGLSTGVIVFTVKLLKPESSIFWRDVLKFGLGLLVFSILIRQSAKWIN